jgi:hypothetical protein
MANSYAWIFLRLGRPLDSAQSLVHGIQHSGAARFSAGPSYGSPRRFIADARDCNVLDIVD